MIDTKELRRLAQAATPGPRKSKGRYIGTPNHMSYIGEVRDQCGNWSDTVKSRADSAFIAAANPATISELLDRLEAAEKECDELHNEIACVKEVEFPRKAQAVADAWKGKCERLEAERDALRAALQHEADCVEAVKSEIEALRAKIAAMEQQKPARLVTPTAYRWRYRGAVKWQYGELTEETARVAKEHNHEVQPLYLAPGAKGE